MAKMFLIAALVVLVAATMTSAEDGSADQQDLSIYQKLKNAGFGRVLDFGCNLRELLTDREASDHIFKIVKGLGKIVDEGEECATQIIRTTANDGTKPIGSLIISIRGGQSSNVDSLYEIFRYLPQYILFNILQPYHSFDGRGIVKQFQEATRETWQECGGKKIETLRPDYDAVVQKYKAIKEANNQAPPA